MRRERGQASIELIGFTFVVVIVLLGVTQLFIAGYTVTSAENAARTGARAASLGQDAEQAARDAMASWLVNRSTVTVNGTEATVRVRMPVLLYHGDSEQLVVGRTAVMPNTPGGGSFLPGGGVPLPIFLRDLPPGEAGLAALKFALAHLGWPYLWGGEGPGGFDCSGLVQAAYQAAGILLPRVAQDQYYATTKLGPNEALKPGDLLFFGTAGNIHHVGIYLGGGLMVDAPHPGAVVRIESYAWQDYFGATRPAP
jgi:cell wall-associated NlpC family hydrolase